MDNKTQDMVTDCCGSFMDVGAVIAEEDNILSVPVSAPSQQLAEQAFAEVAGKAQARFADVKVSAQWDEAQGTLNGALTFSCAAERLIFEMGMN